MNDITRKELYDTYIKMLEAYETMKHLVSQNLTSSEYNRAKAYWIGSIETGLKAEEYFGADGSFKKFLEDSEIMDDCGEFLEENDLENDYEDED
jgi:hypothetical protein